jgi:hypothetical protein
VDRAAWQVQVAAPLLPAGGSLDLLRPVPALKTSCEAGLGLAACPELGLLVTSSCISNTLSVFALPGRSSGATTSVTGAPATTGATPTATTGLTLVCSMGGTSSPPPMRFKFEDDAGYSGWLAFSGPTPCRLLLVTDVGHDAVHVVDVVRRAHVGYVAAPGSIAGPRAVATWGPLAAVTAWKDPSAGSGEHVVRLFEGGGSAWTPVRVVSGGFGGPGGADGQLRAPYGLRFWDDGAHLLVADTGNNRVSQFRVGDGGFVRHVHTGLSGPNDVEVCQEGLLVACINSHTVSLIHGAVRSGGDDSGGSSSASTLGEARQVVSLGSSGSEDGQFLHPVGLVVLPGLGLVIREHSNERLQVLLAR